MCHHKARVCSCVVYARVLSPQKMAHTTLEGTAAVQFSVMFSSSSIVSVSMAQAPSEINSFILFVLM